MVTTDRPALQVQTFIMLSGPHQNCVKMKQDRMFMNKPLQADNVYPEVHNNSLSEIIGFPVVKGKERAIISGGKLVNVVSDGYGLLPNQRFFLEVEHQLREAGVQFVQRSINRNDCSFSVDYILKDDRYHINVKKGTDKIIPMVRFTNSYDGSCKTTGNFGFWREVCGNGLHVAHTEIGFSLKHRGSIVELVMPEVNKIIEKFMDNECYSLHRKFEVLAERSLNHEQVNELVRFICDKTKIFQFESSEKNPTAGLNARTVIETVQRESQLIGGPANQWLVYNGFNEILHGKLKKTFEQQRSLDGKVFETMLALS